MATVDRVRGRRAGRPWSVPRRDRDTHQPRTAPLAPPRSARRDPTGRSWQTTSRVDIAATGHEAAESRRAGCTASSSSRHRSTARREYDDVPRPTSFVPSVRRITIVVTTPVTLSLGPASMPATSSHGT
jgi:hypothetical protein